MKKQTFSGTDGFENIRDKRDTIKDNLNAELKANRELRIFWGAVVVTLGVLAVVVFSIMITNC